VDRLDVGETMRTDMFADMIRQVCRQYDDCDNCVVKRYCKELNGRFADAFVIIQTDIMRHIMEHGTPEEIQIVNDYGCLECNME
jgi:hypothetical protein